MAKRKNGVNSTNTRKARAKAPAGADADAAVAEHLDIPTLETWLWDAACAVRGPVDAPKFKDFIFPLIFYKRLSDVFEDELREYVELYGDEAVAREVIEADHEAALEENRRPIVRFYIPAAYSWEKIRNHGADGGLGEFVTKAMREVAKLNPPLDGVLNVRDYNEKQSGHRTLDDAPLSELVEVISRHRLGIKNAEPDILGRAYEYLLRKFAEGQGQSAGEFYTPQQVGWLMAEILDPAPHRFAYDPTCGSAGLLIKLRLHFERRHPADKAKAPKLFGQEMNPTTFAMAKMNAFLHDFTGAQFQIGDTFRNPGFAAKGAGLRKFDYVTANPMWNQDNYDEDFYENDEWGRFTYGVPPKSSADWGWVQHILASLKDTGRAAVVLDTGAASRGSGSKGNNKEKAIRQKMVEADLIEGVVLLPENLFYNTPAPGIILVLNRHKSEARRGQVMLVNASRFFVKEKPKNVMTDEGIAVVGEVWGKWEAREKLSRIITLDDARKADYNLSPSQFVDVGQKVSHRALSDILADLHDARNERQAADEKLDVALQALGLGN